MKKKEKLQLMNMKPAELMKVVDETVKKLAEARVNRYSKQSKNVREGRPMRQKIAIAKTLLHGKELAHE